MYVLFFRCKIFDRILLKGKCLFFFSILNLFKELKVVRSLLRKRINIYNNSSSSSNVGWKKTPARDNSSTFCLHRGKKSFDYLCGILKKEKENVNHIQSSKNHNRIFSFSFSFNISNCSRHIFCGKNLRKPRQFVHFALFKQMYWLFIIHLSFKNEFILKKKCPKLKCTIERSERKKLWA